MMLLVTEGDIEAIAQVGMEHAPLEACGILLLGVGLRTVQNFAEDPASNSHMKSDDILDAVLDLTHRNLTGYNLRENLIFWHTHPGGQEGPSEVDKAMRDQDSHRMLVVAIPGGQATEY